MRIISRETYVQFMKKYNLKLMTKRDNKYKYKTMKVMSQEIYKYEKDSNNVPNNQRNFNDPQVGRFLLLLLSVASCDSNRCRLYASTHTVMYSSIGFIIV